MLRAFIKLFQERDAAIAILTVTGTQEWQQLQNTIGPLIRPDDVWVPLRMDFLEDPFSLRRQIALQDAAERTLDRGDGFARTCHRQHHDQRQPEQPQADSAGLPT